jgi:ribosomal protein L31E
MGEPEIVFKGGNNKLNISINFISTKKKTKNKSVDILETFFKCKMKKELLIIKKKMSFFFWKRKMVFIK